MGSLCVVLLGLKYCTLWPVQTISFQLLMYLLAIIAVYSEAAATGDVGAHVQTERARCGVAECDRARVSHSLKLTHLILFCHYYRHQLWRQHFQTLACIWLEILGGQINQWTIRSIEEDQVRREKRC